MLRYSLKTLCVVVALVAVACAALLHANAWIASTAWTVVFLLLSMATILAVLTRPDRRGFWTGFALAGWLYVLAGIGPLGGEHRGNLLTTAALYRADSLLQQENGSPAPTSININTGTLSFAYLNNTIPTNPYPASGWAIPYSLAQAAAAPQAQQSFVKVGQSLWTLLLALVGGWLGALVVARRQGPVPRQESTVLA